MNTPSRKKYRYLVLVDVDGSGRDLASYWKKSRFMDRIESLRLPYVIWRRSGGKRLTRLIKGIDAVIYIEGEQLFFDPALAGEAIRKYERYKPDYYTQWEHSRIPVGIGVRIFSVKKMTESRASSVAEYLGRIMKVPQNFSIRYEDRQYADYDRSMLDARYSAAMKKFLTGREKVVSWDLGGFMALAGQTPQSFRSLRYRAAAKAARVDERGMPAAYGFESHSCAGFPGYIMFDMTNVCNSRCAHCPHSITYSQTGTKPVFIDNDVFKKVIDEAARMKTAFIRITADGEPLLHKDLIEMVGYAAGKGVKRVGLTTNGSLMTPEVAGKLMEAGLFMVDFSLDAVKPETYRKIRRGLPFERVIGNIEETIRLRNKKRSPLKIMVSFVRQKENRPEEREFVKKWSSLVDKVLIRELISNVNLIKVNNDEKLKKITRWPCTHLFRRAVINYNGVIKMCPVDWENATSYRSVDNVDIHGAWHSDFYWKNRIEHLNADFSSGSACGNCSDWMGSPWNLGYEKVVKKL